jgi:hypothetical protein
LCKAAKTTFVKISPFGEVDKCLGACTSFAETISIYLINTQANISHSAQRTMARSRADVGTMNE